MAYAKMVLALALAVAPAAASSAQAPSGSETTRYCMRITLTGNIVEPVRCWTRGQWAEQGVDVDREWAAEGIRVIE